MRAGSLPNRLSREVRPTEGHLPPLDHAAEPDPLYPLRLRLPVAPVPTVAPFFTGFPSRT